MRLQDNQEVKVTIGCRVSPEVKDHLYEQARELGFQSFSQYLEDLITTASQMELPEKQGPSNRLTDEDLERLSQLMSERDAEDFKAQLQDIEERIVKLLPIEFTPEQQQLLLDYLNYLVENHDEPDKARALLSVITKALQDGERGFFTDEFPGRTEFLGRFSSK